MDGTKQDRLNGIKTDLNVLIVWQKCYDEGHETRPGQFDV